MLDFCRVRLALMNLLEIRDMHTAKVAAQSAGTARRAALSQIVRTALTLGVEYSMIADVTTQLGEAKLTTANIEKVVQAIVTNIEIHLLQKERQSDEENMARLNLRAGRQLYVQHV